MERRILERIANQKSTDIVMIALPEEFKNIKSYIDLFHKYNVSVGKDGKKIHFNWRYNFITIDIDDTYESIEKIIKINDILKPNQRLLINEKILQVIKRHSDYVKPYFEFIAKTCSRSLPYK